MHPFNVGALSFTKVTNGIEHAPVSTVINLISGAGKLPLQLVRMISGRFPRGSGVVLSITFTVFSHVEVHPFSSVNVNESVKELLHTKPALTVTSLSSSVPETIVAPFPDTRDHL